MLRRWLSFKVATRFHNIVGATSAARLIAGQFKEKKMREYPVGSECVVIAAYAAKEMIGSEVIITGKLKPRLSLELGPYMGYDTDVVGSDGLSYAPKHECLKLKRFPGELHSKCTEFVNKLISPTFDRTTLPVTEDV